ncbi:NADH:flavin oxidoreductase [Aeromicrobium sp. PE09-221]|uniref:NADH:flavin oxidoreductase/NADH oxidase family protein n=1 Tax=Aeromicrobium sp. PE09-221 TaxID=1898043 RepID=UPI000B3EA219|nr:NADH:flavin oxidoreductase/NADH oxidase family protein [Aeromicrobium sp. PE09-221]OUZ09476.1 NADH:flavin oxidoreductase [Aeromicrobium sp. PE09-221]
MTSVPAATAASGESTNAANRSALAQPLELPNGFVIPNRLVKAALSEGLGRKDFSPGTRIRNLYSRWAHCGVGLSITGNVMVDRTQTGEPGNVVVEDHRDLDDLVAWAETARAGGSKAWVQINHPGRQIPRTVGMHPVAPSAIALPGGAKLFAKPRELTAAEIQEIIGRFATAAAVVTEAGFDGVQIHGAHGYLISQFLSPLSNQRTDDWGGTPEKRHRFVLEIVRAIRAEVGVDVPVGIKLNSADFQKGGFSEDESLEVVHKLAEEGIDLLEVSGGTYTTSAMLGVDDSLKESTRKREAYFMAYAERVRADLPDLPLMLTGGFRTADGMVEALQSGAIDLVGLGRPLCVQPDFPAELLAGTADDSVVVPHRTGIRLLDNITEITHYSVQLWRMGNGKEPAPDRHPAFNVSQYLLHNGLESLRPQRA